MDVAVYLEGQTLFRQRCESCHQANGKGVGQLYPDLSDPVIASRGLDLACQIRSGVRIPGSDSSGVRYTMPANPGLNAPQLASLLTYLLNSWGHKEGMVGAKAVQAALADCAAQ